MSPGPGAGSDEASPGLADRIRDAFALLLVVLGVGMVLFAHAGNVELASGPIAVEKGQFAISVWMHYR